MSAPYKPLLSETERRLSMIVERELIGGQIPSINLALAELQPDEDALHDSAFMARYFNTKLGEVDSPLQVVPMERYWFEQDLLGASSDLGLFDSSSPGSPVRLFYFGLYNPGVNWHPTATGDRLTERTQRHFDNIEQKRLHSAAYATTADVAAQVEVLVRRRLAETLPTAEQNRHLKSILPNTYSLKQLDSWAYICQIMGYDFVEILAEACLAIV